MERLDYETLVAEYLDYPLPAYHARTPGLGPLPEPRARNLIYSIIGVRRSGKTFTLFQLMDELHRQGVSKRATFYFPFDDDRFDLLEPNAAANLLDAYYRLVPEAEQGCYLFFDEIQELPNWDSFIRRVAEHNAVTLVVTGSSSKLLSTDIPTKLRGRSLSHEVWPLGFAEFCSFNGVNVPPGGSGHSARQRGQLEATFSRYLEVGGFPAVQHLGQTERTRLLQSYADEIVTKDVLERFGSASYRTGRRFARSALRSTALKFSVNKQIKGLRSAGLSISTDSAYALLDDLEDAHLVFKVCDYNLSIKDNPKSSYKVYAVDPGLSLSVAPANHIDMGQRLETAVFIELKRRYGACRDNVIASYSGPGCPEVDFVVGDLLLEREYELLQVAVDSGAGRNAPGGAASGKYESEVGNLLAAMRNTGLDSATLITLAEEAELEFDEGMVRMLPAWKWFLSC